MQWLISPGANFLVGNSHFIAGGYFDSPGTRGGPAGLAFNGANGGDADDVKSSPRCDFQGLADGQNQ